MTEEVEKYLDSEAMAAVLSVKASTLRTWILEGKLPPSSYLRIGNRYRFSMPRVIAALAPTPTLEDDVGLNEAVETTETVAVAVPTDTTEIDDPNENQIDDAQEIE